MTDPARYESDPQCSYFDQARIMLLLAGDNPSALLEVRDEDGIGLNYGWAMSIADDNQAIVSSNCGLLCDILNLMFDRASIKHPEISRYKMEASLIMADEASPNKHPLDYDVEVIEPPKVDGVGIYCSEPGVEFPLNSMLEQLRRIEQIVLKDGWKHIKNDRNGTGHFVSRMPEGPEHYSDRVLEDFDGENPFAVIAYEMLSSSFEEGEFFVSLPPSMDESEDSSLPRQTVGGQESEREPLSLILPAEVMKRWQNEEMPSVMGYKR